VNAVNKPIVRELLERTVPLMLAALPGTGTGWHVRTNATRQKGQNSTEHLRRRCGAIETAHAARYDDNSEPAARTVGERRYAE